MEGKQRFTFKKTTKFEDVHTGPSSDSLSKAHTPVVPKVAHSWTGQKQGFNSNLMMYNEDFFLCYY